MSEVVALPRKRNRERSNVSARTLEESVPNRLRTSILVLFATASLAMPPYAEAVSFRIYDTVVDPGSTSANVQIVIDPEGAIIDGLQFGVDIDGEAEIRSLRLDNNWETWITGSTFFPHHVEEATQVGTGYTFVLDIDEDDLVRWDTSAPFSVVHLTIDFSVPTGPGETYTVSFRSDLGTPAVPVGYTTGSTFHPTVTTTDGLIRVDTQTRDFDVTGPADVFAAGNWDPTGAPHPADRLYLRNGGSAEGTGGLLQVRSLRVGDDPGDGSLSLDGTELEVDHFLEIAGRDNRDCCGAGHGGTHTFSGSLHQSNAPTFVTEDLLIARLQPDAGSVLTTTGDVKIDQVDQVLIAEDVEIARIDGGEDGLFHDTDAHATGSIEVTNVPTMVIQDDFELGWIANTSGAMPATVTVDATATFRILDTLLIGQDFEVAERESCFPTAPSSGGRSVTGSVEASDIGQLIVVEDLEIGNAASCAAESMNATANAIFEDIARMSIGDDFEVARFLGADGTGTQDINAIARLARIGELAVTWDIEVGVISLDPTDTGTHTLDAALLLEDVTSVDVDGHLRIGAMTQNEAPDPNAEVTIDASMTIEGGTATVEAFTLVGVVYDGTVDAAGSSPVANSRFTPAGTLEIVRTSLVTPLVWVGVVESTVDGEATGRLDLSGYVGTDSFGLGDGGTLILNVAGDDPASPTTEGFAHHARIDVASDAFLEGHIRADVTYTPTIGNHVYDLLVAPAGALSGSTATLEVGPLPTGFLLRSFGIVSEGGFDRLRLEIASLQIFEDGFESGDTSAWTAVVP